MLGWLLPSSCPCDRRAKLWVEERLGWLSEQFDDHAFNGRPLVLPTAEFFPDPYDGSEAAARTLLDRVCDYMDVDPDRVELRFVSDTAAPWLVNEAGQFIPPYASGTYEDDGERSIITLEREGLGHSIDLIGTLAHELAHVRLLGEGRADYEEYDNELLTDLTVVFFGLGIFLANVPRVWESLYSYWPNTRLYKPEYMTPPMFGYALAHLAWFLGEAKPAWARYLHLNARPSFNQALRFLRRTGDSAFKPVGMRQVEA